MCGALVDVSQAGVVETNRAQTVVSSVVPSGSPCKPSLVESCGFGLLVGFWCEIAPLGTVVAVLEHATDHYASCVLRIVDRRS